MSINSIPKFVLAILLLMAMLTVYAQKPTSAELQASKIIEYTNEVIELYNRQIKQLKEYDRVITKGDELFQRYSKNYDPNFPVSFTQTKYPVAAGYISQYEQAETKAAAFPEKNSIVSSVKAARENVKNLDEWSDKMGKYFTEKQFVNDSFAGYPELKDSLEYYLRASKKTWRDAVKKASDSGQAAEITLMKKNPIALFLIPMKTDMKTLGDIIDELYATVDEEGNDKADYSPLMQQVSALNTTLEKDRDVTGRNTSVLDNLSDYDYFFSKAFECTNYISRILDELSKDDYNEDRLDNDFRMLNQEYNNLVGIYNYFID